MLHRINQYIQVVESPRFQFPHCNCLLIEDEQRCLIDTSPLQPDIERISQRPLDLIINSHGHLDHYFYNCRFPDSRIFIHPADYSIATSAQSYADEFAIRQFAPDPTWDELFIQSIQYYPTRIDGEIVDLQYFDFGHTRVQVLHLPGHSTGHCGFFFPEQGFVFSADIDFSSFGPWYGNLHSSIPDLLNSIDRLLNLKPDYYICGHGSPLIREGAAKRLRAYRDIIFQRQRRIVELMYGGRHTIAELAEPLPVYRRKVEPVALFHIFEQIMITIHLQYLEQQGYVLREGDSWFLKKNLSPTRLML